MAENVGGGSNGKQFLGISGGSTERLPGEYERVGTSGRETGRSWVEE
jgi:hypothetical protein